MVASKLDFPSGFHAWDRLEREAIKRVIASDWFTYGPETKAFETEIATFHGRRRVSV